jgi:hypothetical protein
VFAENDEYMLNINTYLLILISFCSWRMRLQILYSQKLQELKFSYLLSVENWDSPIRSHVVNNFIPPKCLVQWNSVRYQPLRWRVRMLENLLRTIPLCLNVPYPFYKMCRISYYFVHLNLSVSLSGWVKEECQHAVGPYSQKWLYLFVVLFGICDPIFNFTLRSW